MKVKGLGLAGHHIPKSVGPTCALLGGGKDSGPEDRVGTTNTEYQIMTHSSE